MLNYIKYHIFLNYKIVLSLQLISIGQNKHTKTMENKNDHHTATKQKVCERNN